MRSEPSVGCCVVAHGRHDHLRNVMAGLVGQRRRPDIVGVVAMGDPAVVDIAEAHPLEVRTASVEVTDGRLPLAAARNRAAALVDTDLRIFLDVDCIPGPGLVADYLRDARPGLSTGTVRYLPAGVPAAGASWTVDTLRAAGRCHPDRLPVARTGASERFELFWSLNFAVDTPTWADLGGFDEGYVGYGAEDTDLAFRARERGHRLWLVAGAEAFHQHHGSQNPPFSHLDDIVSNAARFRRRFGWWPMSGWLDAFEAAGLITIDGDSIIRRSPASPPDRSDGRVRSGLPMAPDG